MVENVFPRFPEREFCFNPEADIQEVDQFGFINLNDAFVNGIVPSDLDFTDDSFNGVQNPGTLISRSLDVFDGLRKAEYVRRTLDKLSAEEREKVEKSAQKSLEAAGPVYDVTS